MMCYDPKTQKSVGIGLLISHCTKFCAFSESLVLLDHNTGPIVDDRLQWYKNLSDIERMFYFNYGNSDDDEENHSKRLKV
ncbi:hypothetical protein vseg_014297 [Gypsophila vaccaria]